MEVELQFTDSRLKSVFCRIAVQFLNNLLSKEVVASDIGRLSRLNWKHKRLDHSTRNINGKIGMSWRTPVIVTN